MRRSRQQALRREPALRAEVVLSACPSPLQGLAVILAGKAAEGFSMAQKIRLQGDSNAHDRPWTVAVEQGFFADEGLTVEFQEDNPKGVAGRVQDFSQRWKESQLQQGA